ncbi:MAG: 3-keto-5-aminohexanoate cleavage protein, partial [Pseudomonadota bacterium]|nr:3-keto-5-aminohexanoate cleavage protein [Pseudomonadota bacterium]
MNFHKPKDLPRLMVAPNGARRTKADHPAIPVTIQETVETALACAAVGAQAMHLHVRDADQQHVLDAGLY